MRARLASSVVMIAVLAAACSGGGGGASARLTVDGTASVTTGGGSPRSVDGSRTLRAGDRVKVDSGTAVIRLADGRQLELRNGTEVELGAPDQAGANPRPSLLSGELLVTGDVAVTAGDTDVAVSGGSARLSRGAAVSVASYTAGVTVASTGRSLQVPALRQVSVPAAGLLPGRPSPLIYKGGDPWDQRFLGDAIDLGTQLVARSRGFTAQLGPNEGRTPGFFRLIIPALENEPQFDEAAIDPERSPGETLVGLAVTVQGTRQSFADRLRDVFAFHDEGAAWGLVALDQGVSRAPLLAGVDEAISRGPLSAAESPPAPPTSAPSLSAPAANDAGPSGGAEVEPSSPSATPSAPGPAPAPPPLTGVPLVDDTVSGLVDVLNGLLGGLGRR
ncbi:MAG: hypothetical protein ACR2HV_03425 [Acidimicrobiales bacterium]